MRTVSFQGTGLSHSQRLRMDQQQAIARSFINPILQAQVDQTIRTLDERKEQGAKSEKVWFLDYEEKGTPCVAEMAGYTL
ncbi:hypothetical protein [Metapseudomonas resinovorans]|uniref:Uncharacterized protein n=1 Tax=Metapseudomonas resinovorans NBRC 106553 TaxID=1245471 RepID=S6AFC0_METRE|nr:hypothetical protein [Pseudomonas resinovorans]BAN48605.1 hypothetical protein PCA10_28730 [Pseudomonas resinovorans NBRC 106553]BAN48617.1 hypothetical protein PCA10_28850 [Pseudomonas resinovorans NBRC 106553]BAN48629.1 hypothetical protein PCA10_28970 [Pseudomonas resinovorans NBRC 106553]